MFFFTKKDDYSNAIGEKELLRESKKALKFESNVFAKTLGPFGMNSILEDRTLQHSITKDGYTVYQNLVIYNRVGRAIVRLIQKISGSLNEIVGDGTTSSVIVANELESIRDLIKKHKTSPRIISELTKLVSNHIVEQIRKFAVPIRFPVMKDGVPNSDMLYKEAHKTITNLAAISLNNDYNRGKLVADIFMSLSDPKNGFINVETSKTNVTHFDKDRGFEIYRGMLLPEMCTEPDGKTAIYQDPYILLVKGQIMTNDSDAIQNILNLVIGKLDKPLVIIAGGYSQAISETIRQSLIAYAERNNKKMPLLCVEIDTESSIGKDELMDIEANIGARVITVEAGKNFPVEENPEKYLMYMGHCAKIVSKTTTYTRILQGKIDKSKANFRISEIEKEIEQMKSEQHLDNSFNIFKLNRRKAILQNDMITLFVGGDTMEEKESTADLFDDAVRGCRSAAANGVVPGGNTIVANITHFILTNDAVFESLLAEVKKNFGSSALIGDKKLREIVYDLVKTIKDSYIRSYAIVLNNKFQNKRKSYQIAKKCVESGVVYNLITDKYEEFSEELENGELCIHDDALVMNSAETDIRILIAATSIIDLIITSNQFIRLPDRNLMQKNM